MALYDVVVVADVVGVDIQRLGGLGHLGGVDHRRGLDLDAVFGGGFRHHVRLDLGVDLGGGVHDADRLQVRHEFSQQLEPAGPRGSGRRFR
ncbi:MAG: hypothetical protein R2722_14320 [Tessaracoccus sp.]